MRPPLSFLSAIGRLRRARRNEAVLIVAKTVTGEVYRNFTKGYAQPKRSARGSAVNTTAQPTDEDTGEGHRRVQHDDAIAQKKTEK